MGGDRRLGLAAFPKRNFPVEQRQRRCRILGIRRGPAALPEMGSGTSPARPSRLQAETQRTKVNCIFSYFKISFQVLAA